MGLLGQWNMNPALNTPVCVSQGKQIDLRMIDDGKGGAFITWKDYRAQLTYNPDIYIQRVNGKGVPMWTNNGLAICTDSADQSTPNIISDMKGGAIVAWSDWRNGTERDLYAQRVDSNGTILWTVQGANVSNLPPREHSEKLVSDGHSGVIVVFEKQLSNVTFHWEIWAQRLDSAGNKMWGPGGIPLSQSIANRRNHKAQKDRNGGAIIAWQELDSVTNTYNIVAQRVDANGNLKWGNFGKIICNAAGDQINAKIDPDSLFNGAFIAWQDTRNTLTTDYDMYIQRIDSNGNAKWAPNGNAVCTASGNQSALDLMSVATTNETIITWKDNRMGNYDIYAQKFDMNGLAKWTSDGIPICSSPLDQINPNLSTDENKGAIIVWQDESLGDWNIRAQRIDNAGNTKWTTNGEWVSTASGEQSSPKNCTDGKGGSIFAWQDLRTDTFDIYIHHLFASGSPNTVLHVDEPKGYSLYPNPANDFVDIRCEGSHKMTALDLLDATGRILFSSPLKNESVHRVQTDSWPQGVYWLRIKFGENVGIEKVIKR